MSQSKVQQKPPTKVAKTTTQAPTTTTPPDQIQIFSPRDHPAVAASYSQISIVPLSPTSKLVSLAGQTGRNYANPSEPIPDTFLAQVRLALGNVDALLAAAGAKKSDIITNRQYVVKMSELSREDFLKRANIVRTWFGRDRDGLPPPPDTLIGVESLAQTGGKGEYLYEIEVQAVVHSPAIDGEIPKHR